MNEFVIWEKGRPIAATVKEAKRLKKRLQIIDEVLKEMGYVEGVHKYVEITTEMAKNDFPKYLELVDRVSKIAKKRRC